jgi:hypothetical protein
MSIDEEIERLEGPRCPMLEPQSADTKMWKRSYLIALYAIGTLEKRVKRLSMLDGPMTFFYPPRDSDCV